MAWVRVASFDGGDTEKLRERAESGAMPDNPPGMQGAMVFATPDDSKRVFVAWFDSKESLEASADHFERMGDEMPEEIRGRRVGIEAYEVVFNSWEQ